MAEFFERIAERKSSKLSENLPEKSHILLHHRDNCTCV